jgi:hypothetical protein
VWTLTADLLGLFALGANVRSISALAAFIVALAMSSPALSGVYADTLGKCLVSSTTDADKLVLGQWMFAAMSANPKLNSMVSITPAQRDEISHKFADLTQRLLLIDCRKETVEALRYEGTSVFEASFKVLGDAASQTILNDPSAQMEIGRFASFFDKDKFSGLMAEAGISGSTK